MKYCNKIRLQERIEQIVCRTTASIGWWQQQLLSKLGLKNRKTTEIVKGLWEIDGESVLGRLKCGNTGIQEQCQKEAEIRTWIQETILLLSFHEWQEHYRYWYILSETKCSYFNIQEYFTTFYLKFLFQKFHFTANTQLGAHLVFQTEIQAELFSVKYQPLFLNVIYNIHLTNQQIRQ